MRKPAAYRPSVGVNFEQHQNFLSCCLSYRCCQNHRRLRPTRRGGIACVVFLYFRNAQSCTTRARFIRCLKRRWRAISSLHRQTSDSHCDNRSNASQRHAVERERDEVRASAAEGTYLGKPIVCFATPTHDCAQNKVMRINVITT